ncbi:glycosyltransferase family 2 protein [Oleiagrimonas soli]|uniref:GT2 family glycosyltransferase n=1 Tax=Oleiagrimonas soli TaxID=1543381 RepID=A0A841KNY3_9GAMM|nr:glycosyltransferase [Oleiagrimonas soli]MBB6185559.1 GT2 family glycosyltransferase [Oleiagrimonas soli]
MNDKAAGDAQAAICISICIANYNGERFLDDCLASIYAQNFARPIEILIHDDASTDGSLDVLRLRHPKVFVIVSKENVGYCCSNNRLVERARGEYVLLLNNDAALRQGALQALLDEIPRTTDPFVLTLPQYDWHTGRLVDYGVRLDIFHTPVANRDAACGRLAYVQGACMFMRKDAWDRLGGFPEWMVSNVEDTYLCSLARLRGGTVGVARASGYDHRQGSSFGGNRIEGVKLYTTYRRRYLSERNRASLILVCTPTVIAWLLYGLQLAWLLIEGVAMTLLKRDAKVWRGIYWKAVRDSLRIVSTLRHTRRQVQAGRKIGFWSYMRIFDPVPHKLRLLFRHGLPHFG